jgi:hypothetical protein
MLNINSMLNRYAGQGPRPRWGLWIVLALAIGALAVPSASLAGAPSDSEYDTTNHQIAAGGGGPSEGSGPSGGSGGPEGSGPSGGGGGNEAVISGLPFTGFDVGVLALASVALLGAGLTLRRLSDPARRSS